MAHDRNRVFCWRYQGLTAIERPMYYVGISFGLPWKPEASRNGKSRKTLLVKKDCSPHNNWSINRTLLGSAVPPTIHTSSEDSRQLATE